MQFTKYTKTDTKDTKKKQRADLVAEMQRKAEMQRRFFEQEETE